jgi:hypothetical protein
MYRGCSNVQLVVKVSDSFFRVGKQLLLPLINCLSGWLCFGFILDDVFRQSMQLFTVLLYIYLSIFNVIDLRFVVVPYSTV